MGTRRPRGRRAPPARVNVVVDLSTKYGPAESEPCRYYQSYRTLSFEAARWVVAAPPGDDTFIVENVGGEVARILGERVLLSGAPARLLAARTAGS